MLKIISLVLLGTISLNVLASGVTVYRWVDKQGVVHYGQHEPDHNEYVELSVTTESSPTVAKLDPVNKQRGNGAQASDAIARQCDISRQNLRTLQQFKVVQMVDENGKTRRLSEMERQQRIELSEREVEVYCD
ncbi:DUF4124 domain-containing protein [Thalassotalea maritima]|uniref:DUF4124 domain-containing protein n=1 Tax=Thalassotalea maritima TaxID=3242416 RepID=UPI003528CE06